MGRKAKTLSLEQIEQIPKLAAVLNQTQLADYFGMGAESFRRLAKENPEIDSAYKKGVSEAISEIGGSLVAKARDGDLGAMIFFLKCRANWKEKSEVEVTGQSILNHNISFPNEKD